MTDAAEPAGLITMSSFTYRFMPLALPQGSCRRGLHRPTVSPEPSLLRGLRAVR